MEPVTKQDLKGLLKEFRESIKEDVAEAFDNSKPVLGHATSLAASPLLSTDAPASPTTIVDVVPMLVASAASAKPLDIDATGVVPPTPTTYSTECPSRDVTASTSVFTLGTTPISATSTIDVTPVLAPSMVTNEFTRPSRLLQETAPALIHELKVLRPLPWPSFKYSQVSTLWQLENFMNHTKVPSVGIIVHKNNCSKHLVSQDVGRCLFMIRHMRHMFRPRPWPWFKYELVAGYLEEPFSCLLNSYLATVAAHLFQSMQKMGALSTNYSNDIFFQFIHIGPYELVCAAAVVVYLFEDYLRPVNLELPQEWPPLVKSNSSELCSFKLLSSIGLQLIQFEPLLSSGPTSITEQWQLNCDKHADVRTIPWHEKLQWTVQIMSVSTHWQFLSQEEFKWNVQCRPEKLVGVLRARIQLAVLINFEYCSFKFRPDLILLVWPPARERTPEVKFSFAKALFADAHAQDIRSACYMICRCTLSKFMRSPGYTAQPTFVVTKLQLTETLSLSSCRLWSEPPSKLIHRKKFNYKDLQSYSYYVLQSQAGTECLLHCNVSYEFYLQKFALVWKVDKSGSNNSALRVITSLVHIRNTCSFWNMLVLDWRSRRLSVEKLQGEIPSCDILVLTWLGSSTSYKACALVEHSVFVDTLLIVPSMVWRTRCLQFEIDRAHECWAFFHPNFPWHPYTHDWTVRKLMVVTGAVPLSSVPMSSKETRSWTGTNVWTCNSSHLTLFYHNNVRYDLDARVRKHPGTMTINVLVQARCIPSPICAALSSKQMGFGTTARKMQFLQIICSCFHYHTLNEWQVSEPDGRSGVSHCNATVHPKALYLRQPCHMEIVEHLSMSIGEQYIIQTFYDLSSSGSPTTSNIQQPKILMAMVISKRAQGMVDMLFSTCFGQEHFKGGRDVIALAILIDQVYGVLYISPGVQNLLELNRGLNMTVRMLLFHAAMKTFEKWSSWLQKLFQCRGQGDIFHEIAIPLCFLLPLVLELPLWWDPGGQEFLAYFMQTEAKGGGKNKSTTYCIDQFSYFDLNYSFKQVPVDHKFYFVFDQVHVGNDDKLRDAASSDLVQIYFNNGYHISTKECRVSWDSGDKESTLASAWGQAEFQGGRGVSSPARLGLGPASEGWAQGPSHGNQRLQLPEGLDRAEHPDGSRDWRLALSFLLAFLSHLGSSSPISFLLLL